MRHQPEGAVYDLIGPDRIDYIDMIRAIRDVKGLRTPIVHVPVPIFSAMLRCYALFIDKPPFTADQLKALTAGDDFTGVDIARCSASSRPRSRPPSARRSGTPNTAR